MTLGWHGSGQVGMYCVTGGHTDGVVGFTGHKYCTGADNIFFRTTTFLKDFRKGFIKGDDIFSKTFIKGV
jgi:hypothetical protein